MGANGKKMALAMKKKGVGIFAPKKLSEALAAICGGKTMPRTEVTKKIWVYIKKNSLNQGRVIKPDAQPKSSDVAPGSRSQMGYGSLSLESDLNSCRLTLHAHTSGGGA